MHVTVNLKPALSLEHEEGTPPSLFQTCPVEHILAPCYYFSLQQLPLLFIFNGLLFDEKIVEGEGAVMSPSL